MSTRRKLLKHLNFTALYILITLLKLLQCFLVFHNTGLQKANQVAIHIEYNFLFICFKKAFYKNYYDTRLYAIKSLISSIDIRIFSPKPLALVMPLLILAETVNII